MEYCHYHPAAPATNFCPKCKTTTCESCVNYSERKRKNLCYVCNNPTDSLGASYNAQPFWRRLDKSFRYPLNTQSLIIIIGVAVLSSFITYLPLGWFMFLAITGGFYKYAFACLENSAWGNFKEVDLNEAFEGGIALLFQLIAIVVGMAAMVIGAGYLGGEKLALIVGLFFAIGYPAILINFALTKSISEALNPSGIIRLISATGLAYGLLLVFIFIMIASVGVISQVLSSIPHFASFILESAISNYYTLVAFHIMGYMIFQYQGKLGFTAEEDYGEETEQLDEKTKVLNQINIWVKEGNAEKALELYNNLVEKYPNDIEIYNDCYRLLIETKNTERLVRFSSWYFDILLKSQNPQRASHVFKEVSTLKSGFIPEKVKHRHLIAEQRLKKDDYMAVVKLLNGIHKVDPDYKKLGDCYSLLVEALSCIPKYEAQVPKVKQLAAHFAKKQKEYEKAHPPASPVTKTSANAGNYQAEPGASETDKDASIDFPSGGLSLQNQEEEKPAEEKPKDLPPIDFPGFSQK